MRHGRNCGKSQKRSQPHISAALPAHTIISYYSLWQMAGGEWQEGSGVQLPVTTVPSMSSGPFWQLKLDVCVPSASSNSYKSLQLSECY